MGAVGRECGCWRGWVFIVAPKLMMRQCGCGRGGVGAGRGVGGGRSGRHGRAGRNNHIITAHTSGGAGVPAVLSDGRDVGGPGPDLTVGVRPLLMCGRRHSLARAHSRARTPASR